VEARNDADSLIYTTEKTLSELGEKLSNEQKGKIESCMKKLKDALHENDIEKIKKETENLQKTVGEAGASIYQKAAEAANKSAEEQGKKGGKPGKKEKKKDDEKVVDAEYKVDEEENDKEAKK